MNWVSSHPYASSILLAVVLVIFGASVVVPRTATAPLQYQPSTWSGAGGITASPVQPSSQGSSELPRPGNPTSVVPYRYISPFGTGNGAQADPSDDTGIDLSEFEKILTKGPNEKDPDISTTNAADSYEFIPTGMISLPDTSRRDTPAQTELRSFGNDIGGIIQSFEQSNPDQPAILKNFMEDRNDAGKIAGMKNLGAQLKNIGTLMQQQDPIPKQMKPATLDLANHYVEIGTLLAAIPDAKGDDSLYNAIIAYNEAAERFVGSLVSFALLFQANGVVFSQEETGSVFMFQQSSGGL
jgi:hypothetical protein